MKMGIGFGIGICNALTALNKIQAEIRAEIKKRDLNYIVVHQQTTRRIEILDENQQVVESFNLWDDALDYLKSLPV